MERKEEKKSGFLLGHKAISGVSLSGRKRSIKRTHFADVFNSLSAFQFTLYVLLDINLQGASDSDL